MTTKMTMSDSDVLLVIDIQNDFCPGGQLAVPRGDEVVPSVNGIAMGFKHVVLTQDWHPPGHQSFASSHPGRRPFETIAVSYGSYGVANFTWTDMRDFVPEADAYAQFIYFARM